MAAVESTAASNRRFGAFLEMADTFPKALIALVEGACMGGGVGLVAVADWVIAEKAAQIGTPEVTVGIVPAQITPFIVHASARRMRGGWRRSGSGSAPRKPSASAWCTRWPKITAS